MKVQCCICEGKWEEGERETNTPKTDRKRQEIREGGRVGGRKGVREAVEVRERGREGGREEEQ